MSQQAPERIYYAQRGGLWLRTMAGLDDEVHYIRADIAQAQMDAKEDELGRVLADLNQAERELDSLRAAQSAAVAEKDERIAELERRLRIPYGKLPCALCGGPHDFDTSVPSDAWNRIIRAKGLPEYLCMTCIVREFVKDGEGFTATLWNEEFNGVAIEVVIK